MSDVAVSLRLVVLKASNLEVSRTFYEALGLSFTREQHGGGPAHLAAALGDVVFELYPGSVDAAHEGRARLGFGVPDLAATMRALQALEVPIIREPRATRWGTLAVVRDPDGRAVELTQR